MKKVLFITGGALLIGSLIYYFKRQIDLALKYDYRITGLKLIDIKDGKSNLELTLEAVNKSNFGLVINSYNLNFYYQGQHAGTAISSTPLTVPPDQSFQIMTQLSLDNKKFGELTLLALKTAIAEKPIVFEIDGVLNVTFMGITRNFKVDRTSYTFSENILAEYNLSDQARKWRDRLSVLGITF